MGLKSWGYGWVFMDKRYEGSIARVREISSLIEGEDYLIHIFGKPLLD